jgi:hypothetical protein
MESQLIKSEQKMDTTLVSTNQNEMDIKIRIAIEKCFLSAGYQVIDGVVIAIVESVKEQLPSVTIGEFISKLKKFRNHNKERISVPLILEQFKPWKKITSY